MSSVTMSAVSTLASIIPSTLASVTTSTIASGTPSSLASANPSSLASVTMSSLASFTTSTQASAITSTSPGHEATQGDKAYLDYREMSTLPPDVYNYVHRYETLLFYPVYSFERSYYMYIWGILVIITFLANILVISVLLRKKMRNPTYMIMTAIAISDSLTGLVTLPSYWAVNSKFHPAENYSFYEFYDYATSLSPLTNDNESAYQNEAMPNPENYAYTAYEDQDGYFLTKSLCRSFMISKFFLSKTFHTVSIWLTLFLGFQRFISVASPFRAKKLFCERNVVIICVVIAVAAPVLHIYHLVDDKAESNDGTCTWDLEENCAGGCAHLVITFLLRHLVPCILLLIFTVLFIIQLTKCSSRLSRIDSNRGNAAMQHRDSENRRISIVVVLIVVVFLIPEVPYGGFLLYALIGKLTHVRFELETNRAIHLAYEVSLVLSFHANFYIYAFFNRRFRKSLLRGIVYPILTCCGRTSLCGIEAIKDMHSGTSYKPTGRQRTLQCETGTKVELTNIKKGSSNAERSTNVGEASQFVNGKPHEEQENIDEKSKGLPRTHI